MADIGVDLFDRLLEDGKRGLDLVVGDVESAEAPHDGAVASSLLHDESVLEAAALHLECDVSAMENSLGYELGSWVPYMTIDFEVINEATGETAAEGSFMVMAASDGPHYGANIALPEAGTYTVRFTFHSPAENGYLVHSDAETGPGGLLEDVWGDGPLTLEYKGWDYIPQEW